MGLAAGGRVNPERRIIVNMRSQAAGLTGVQRYAQRLCAALGSGIRTVKPLHALQGLRGHLWEQAVLPIYAGQHLLWSPTNTGPLKVRRQVLTVHDVASLDHPEWFDAKFAAWYRWLTPLLVKRVRRVITISEFSRQRIAAITGLDPAHIAMIPPGVDRRFYPRPSNEVLQVREKLQIPSQHYVLSLGSIEPRKNLPRLLDAWSRCVKRLGSDIWLVIAGASGQRHIFRELKLDHPPAQVHVLGFVDDDDLPALYSGALLLAYPSMYEGFGLPVLEAMAAGTVPVTGHSTALPEVAGDAGVFVDASDVEAIADGIVTVIEDSTLRDKLRLRGRERSRLFSWERAAQATLGVFAQALDQ
jgi:glycosyltransferase involved in cell wall biosynthesis